MPFYWPFYILAFFGYSRMKDLFDNRKRYKKYCYENGNDVIKKASKTKTMNLFTWSINKQKYSNNISIKKGINKSTGSNNSAV